MNTRKVVAILMTLISVILLTGRAYAELVCRIDSGAERSIVTKVGKRGEFVSLYGAGERVEAIRCCVACLPQKGSKIIITDQGFLSHTI